MIVAVSDLPWSTMRPTACEVTHIPDEAMDEQLLGQSVAAETAHAPEPEGSAPEESVFVFPASLEQIRYWTLDQLDGKSTASNMAIAARLEGEVDDALVEQAVAALVGRHEALRTTFRVVDGHLSQIISEQSNYSFTISDLRTLPAIEVAAAAEAAVEEHSHARADLATGPAFFARLIQLTDKLHILAFTMHHIVCDGWSNGILIRDFTDFYSAFSQNREPELPELPFQFADFTVWQHEWLESDAAKAALEYWRTHIRREMPAIDLPADRPRLPQKSYPGHIESTLLPTALTARLKAYCRTHGATMHQVMLAAFEGLLARYTSQHEFLLGSTIANRTQPGMENVVGRFANPQVILADVNGDPSYAELLRRVSEWSAASYAHQDLPFSRLMEEFQLDQAGASSQFLQVYFVYQKAFMQPHEGAGLKVVPRPSVSGGVNFDLLVSIVERAEGSRLQMEYNTVLFHKERIVGLIEMYLRVLEAVMEDDSILVSRLPLGSKAAKSESTAATSAIDDAASSIRFDQHAATSAFHQLSTGSAATPSSKSLGQYLDELATSCGNAVAISTSEEQLRWDVLLARSMGIEEVLGAMGLRAGDTVLLRLDNPAHAAASSMALLRMGAVILPLRSAASSTSGSTGSTSIEEWSRLNQSQKPAMTLASAEFAAHVAGVTSYEKLLVKSKTQIAHREINYPRSETLAWLGVHFDGEGALSVLPATHHATLQHLLAATSALDVRAGDTVLVTASDSTTDAWIDLMLPLVAGATAVFANARETSHLQLGTLLGQYQASFLLASPSTLASAIHDRWAGDRRLNVVVRGGILTSSQAQRIAATPLRLWSLLSSPLTAGPMAIAKIAADAQPRFLPLEGDQLFVLDENDQQVPPGVSGELAVSSNNNVTRSGYLARATAQSESYRGVEILDQVSRLVRLHGNRLRVGELEEILWQSHVVSDAFAAVLPVDGVSTLVGWYRTFETGMDSVRLVRDQFQRVAPGHLAAAELIPVSFLPRREDGSVAVNLLPAPGMSNPSEAADDYVAPRDELESNLVAIWEDVLGVRPIGIRTRFFKLGGYSLMIVRLFARINKALGTSLPITTIFNAPTVEQLADIVRGRAYYSSLVPVQTKGTQPPFFMIHSYLLYSGIPAVLGEQYPFYGLRELDTDAEDMTVEQRAATYLDAMRSIQPHGPYYIGGWCAAGPLAVETARQIAASGEEVGYLVLFDSWRPGYAAELAKQQAGSAEMALAARLSRKIRFHRKRWQSLSLAQRMRYVAATVGNKFASMRNRIYLKNWAMAEWFCGKFGLSLPHFMHNVSLTTLNSLKEYRGIEPYTGALTLIRAKEAPYIPGAQEHCGWDSIVKGGIKVLWAPGDHESMFLEPHLQQVGNLLHSSLDEARPL